MSEVTDWRGLMQEATKDGEQGKGKELASSSGTASNTSTRQSGDDLGKIRSREP